MINPKGERLAKVMAHAGLCSRREAEAWILEGRVLVDGLIVTTPAIVVTDQNEVVVDGQSLKKVNQVRLWKYYKPTGLITSHKDPQGRPTVFESLPDIGERLISVGRLDFNSEGLLLLTNNGGVARILELPKTGLSRQYRVRAYGNITDKDLETLKEGITVDDVHYKGIETVVERRQGANMWLRMTLFEGKNREIRRIIQALGGEVNRLIRVAYGPFDLEDMEPGEMQEVSAKDIQHFLQPLIDENEL